MMPRKNNHIKKTEQSFETSRKDKKQGKVLPSISPKQQYNLHSKQIESRIQYINFKEDSQSNINRLDLIFQKQPKQIQQKLIKLLISYNAVLQYNKNTDLFEVDLLLPFLSEEEKKEFVRQFLQIRRNKNIQSSEVRDNSISGTSQNKQRKKQSKGNLQSKQIRKFSFNNKNNFMNEFQEQLQNQSQQMMEEINYEQQRIEQQNKKLSFVETEPMKDYFQPREPLIHVPQKLNLKKIQETISQRLRNAVNIITMRNYQQKNKQNQNNSILISEEKKQEESIIERLQENNQSNGSYKLSDKNSHYIKQDVIETEQPSQERAHNRNYYEDFNPTNNYHSEKYREVIEEQQEDEEYEPLFNHKQKKNEKVTSFQDYTKKYITLKQEKGGKSSNHSKKSQAVERTKGENQVSIPRNYFSYKEKDTKKSDKSNNPYQMAQRERMGSRPSSSRSRSISNHKQSPSKESIEIKQNLNDFFSQHRQNLQKFYSQIRSKIKAQPKTTAQNTSTKAKQIQKPAQKSSQDFYILVLDDLQHEQSRSSQSVEIPNSKEFKSQMLREYRNQILINSKNLSSQDLIRYFRYLHSNAKKLYIKYLINKQK